MLELQNLEAWRDDRCLYQGLSLALQPGLNDNEDVLWACGLKGSAYFTSFNQPQNGNSAGASEAATTLSSRFLPQSCQG